jgi:hypothetical protein
MPCVLKLTAPLPLPHTTTSLYMRTRITHAQGVFIANQLMATGSDSPAGFKVRGVGWVGPGTLGSRHCAGVTLARPLTHTRVTNTHTQCLTHSL